LFSLLAEAVADIRRIREVHQGVLRPEIQRRKFEAWERGQIVSSAGFILDFSLATCTRARIESLVSLVLLLLSFS
jgi:hypothetical protein